METPSFAAPRTESGKETGPPPTTTDVRALIVHFMRGRFVTPVLAQLGAVGVLNRLAVDQLFLDDYPQFNPHVLQSLLNYLEALGLVETTAEGAWRATIMGRKVFQRWGGFAIVDSYESYFSRLDDLLRSDVRPADVNVDRKKNVIGSGQLHARKFFPAALDMLNGDPPDIIVDIGCGDGAFLEAALIRFPDATVVAVDISAELIRLAYERLAPKLRTAWHSAVADGADVALWSQAVPVSSKRVIISAWFVLHEFCGGSVENALEFLFKTKQYFPTAEIVIGEVVKATPETLSQQHGRSVLPEFQLFHALSGQGLLSWDQLCEVRTDVPYRLVGERLIDSIPSPHGDIPANVIWHLLPR
jgi:hypothetical protein